MRYIRIVHVCSFKYVGERERERERESANICFVFCAGLYRYMNTLMLLDWLNFKRQ